LHTLGRALRFHPVFGPAGTNVDFVSRRTGCAVEIRTYERGVERETLACGTGSIAAASVSVLVHGLMFPVDVRVQSGETLRIHGREESGKITDVVLEGQAAILFSGELLYEARSGKIL